jgi:predicted ester cyclase
MVIKNSDILRGYFDEIVNQKKLEKLPQYLHEQFISHRSPYVGLGLATDDGSKGKVIISTIHPGSPADGKLQVGDEILQFQDGEHTWNTYAELRSGMWGQGMIGTTVSIRVKRAGEEHEYQVMRGLVEGFQFSYSFMHDAIPNYFDEWPDIHFHLVHILEAGDMVAYYGENQGRNIRFNRSAIWGECGMVRVQDSRIIEWWSQEDSFSWMRQLGFALQEPNVIKG